MDDHPEDESEHNGVPQIIHQGAGQQAPHAADQAAEGIMEGVGKDCDGIARRDGKDLHEHIAAHACDRHTDTCESSEEGMHPADEHHADDHQGPEALPSIFKIAVAVDIQDVFDRRESHGCDRAVDDPVQDRIELLAEHQKDDQDGQSLQCLFDNGSDNGGGAEFRRALRAGQRVDAKAKSGIQDERAAAGNEASPEKGGTEKQLGLLLVAIQPVDERRKQEHRYEPKE